MIENNHGRNDDTVEVIIVTIIRIIIRGIIIKILAFLVFSSQQQKSLPVFFIDIMVSIAQAGAWHFVKISSH